MAEETEAVVEATEEVTTSEDLAQPKDNLAPEIEGQETPSKPDLEADPEGGKQEASKFDPEAEQLIEFNGKTYTLKGRELQSILDNQASIAEKEKALNRDYTQKTQALARERKSIEAAFGRMPEPEEINALGKLYQSYLSNPEVAKVIDAILNGEPLDSLNGSAPNQVKQSNNPEVSALNQKIRQLEGQLSKFVSTSEQKEQEAAYNEGKRLFDSWRDAKQKSGQTIPEEIIDAVIETATVLRRRNPSWDTQKALDEALRRETIDQVEKTTAQKVLANADKAKKNSAIKITPKSAQKSDASMGYRDIFQSAM